MSVYKQPMKQKMQNFPVLDVKGMYMGQPQLIRRCDDFKELLGVPTCLVAPYLK